MQTVDNKLGIRTNRWQFTLQLIQVFLVGLTIGMTRTVVPGLAETEFGLAEQQFFLLSTFVIVFGVIKALMNLWAGRLSDQFGRKRVLLLGWIVALPIPFLLLYAQNWYWIIAATVLLGLNQGLAWSMALNSKLDLAKPTQRGLVNGLNEFSGYAAVGVAGVVTAVLATEHGAKEALFLFSSIVIISGLIIAIAAIKDTLAWSQLHYQTQTPQQVENNTESTAFSTLFAEASWRNPTLVALNQAGLVEKFTDALIWIFVPVYFLSQSLSLVAASGLISIYAITWGGSQLITGPLSDRIGRKPLIVWGMWLCGFGVIAITLTNSVWLWSVEAVIIGIGMAMLYPNLGAAVADFSPPLQRASLIGIYRFWRDLGYAVGALAMGLLAQWLTSLDAAFWLVGIAMLLSGLWVQIKLPTQAEH